VEETCAADLWPVLADATQLHQVLLNLCVNARDAMPGGGTLALLADNAALDEHYVSMHNEATPGPYVRIQVRDTGTGMSESVRERIFESFFTTRGDDQGTGLGLTTVLGIVKNHNGFMTCATALGQGTTFDVYLPASPEAEPDSGHSGPPASIRRGHGELVLVVDDEPAICSATRRTLEREGYKVMLAHDGIDALAQFVSSKVQVRAIVTDVMMPLMDGITLCRTLRALSPQTPVIVSTGGLGGKPDGEAPHVLKGLGVRHILHKPHSANVLLEALGEALAERCGG
jgi:CheY-like chemotaxis protein